MEPEPRPGDTIVEGMRTLRERLVFGFIAAFVAVYSNFFWQIWEAPTAPSRPASATGQ